MQNLNKILIIIILIQFLTFGYLSAMFEKANVSIKLQDKEENILPNLKFNIFDSANNLIVQANTNDKGIFKTKLSKGDAYQIRFELQNKEWRFNLTVPNKPGPRSYKYTFKVFIETRLETMLETSTDFKKKNKSICKTLIRLRDDSGLPLPQQNFKVNSLNSDFLQSAQTDSSGEHIFELKNGQLYNIEAEIDGYVFNTTFRLPYETVETTFNFDIDFSKISNVEIETTTIEFPEDSSQDILTHILVIDPKEHPVKDANVILEESNKVILNKMTKEEGKVDKMTKRERVYELYVRKNRKTFKYELIMPKDKTITEYTYIAKVDFEWKPKRKFTLEINFDSGKWDLRKQDIPEMDGLLNQLKENHNLIIEIGGHTDYVGSASSNQRLSERRARTCQSYLTDRGIEIDRVKAKGYGETRPVASNKTKRGRFLNRRIEVSVLAE